MTKEKSTKKSSDDKADYTVKLAKDRTPPTFAEEDGDDAEIRLGMDMSIFVPSLKEQKHGFTPYSLDEDGNRVDATKALLTQYPGIYLANTPLASK